MGYFSKIVFSTEKLPENVILFAGMLYPQKHIRSILGLFDSSTKLSNFQPVLSYIVTKKGNEWLLCFGAYGGTSALEITNLLADGGAKNIYFIGWAGSTHVPVGTINIPRKVKCIDGITRIDSPKADFTKPSDELLQKVSNKLSGNAILGTHVTIPGLLHRIAFIDKELKKYDTLDTELSVVLHFSRKAKINAVGILIVIDSSKSHKEPINPDMKFSLKTRYVILVDVVRRII